MSPQARVPAERTRGRREGSAPGAGFAPLLGPRILLIGGSYRALYVLERLLERGERVVAFLGEEGSGERDFCPEILEVCDRAGVPARSARKLGEEIVRWLEDRIQPDLVVRVGAAGELPLAIGGNCRLGLVEIETSQQERRSRVRLRHQGRELERRELDLPKEDERASQCFVRVTEEALALLEQYLEQLDRVHVRPIVRVPFEDALPAPARGRGTRPASAGLARELGAGGVAAVRCAEEGVRALCAALELPEGAEVVVPALVSGSVVRGLLRAGLRPVFADVLSGSLALDPYSARTRLSRRTRAIVVSHAFGFSPPREAIAALVQERGLRVIEDAGRAPGAVAAAEHPCLISPPGTSAALLSWPRDGYGAAALERSAPRLRRRASGLLRWALEELRSGQPQRLRHAEFYRAQLRRYDAFALAPAQARPNGAAYPLGITSLARTSAEDLERLLREVGVETRRPPAVANERALCESPRAATARETVLLLPTHPGLDVAMRDALLDALFEYAIG